MDVLSSVAISGNLPGSVALILLPLWQGGVALAAAVPLRPARKRARVRPALLAALEKGAFALLLGGVGVLACIGAILLWGNGVGEINRTGVNLTLWLAYLSVCAGVALVRMLRVFPKNRRLLTGGIAALLALCAACQFLSVEGYDPYCARNRAAYQAAFGTPQGTFATLRPYSFATRLFSPFTLNYRLERDLPYATTPYGDTLRYDAYLPTTPGPHPVLVNLHGSGGDKDTGNYAHRNKFFASLGAVVCDIQYGEEEENGVNGVPEFADWESERAYYLDNLHAFLTHATQKWGGERLYLTGVSLGASLNFDYAYRFPDALPLSGILPVYPPSWLEWEEALTLASARPDVPCLMTVATRDHLAWEQAAAAVDAFALPHVVCLWVEFAGHSSDQLFSGRMNQTFNYYAERFLFSGLNG